MKKIFVVLVLSALLSGLLSLGACFGPSSEFPFSPDTGSQPAESSDEKVGVAVYIHTEDPENGDMTEILLKTVQVSKGESFTFTAEEKQYYTVDAAKSVLSAMNVQRSARVDVYYVCEHCIATFAGGDGAVLKPGEGFRESQDLRKGQSPSLPGYEKKGCRFLGFRKTGDTSGFYDGSALYSDSSFEAVWETITYTLTLSTEGHDLDAPGFSPVPGETDKYRYDGDLTYYTPAISLPEPDWQNDAGGVFTGWMDAATGICMTEIPQGVESDIILTPVFSGNAMRFVVPDGEISFDSVYKPAGECVYPPYIPPVSVRAGCGLYWYEDEDFTDLYTFDVMPEGGRTLYGRWEEDRGTGFLNWDYASGTIDNFREFVSYADYIAYHYIDGTKAESERTMRVTYRQADEMNDEFGKVVDAMEYNGTGGLGISVASREGETGCDIKLSVTNNLKDREAIKTTEGDGSCTPYKYAGYERPGRGDGYTAFYIDKLPESYETETSNQLVYLAEHGYRPSCAEGSVAEEMYGRAKHVLNMILKEDDSDYEKALRIFDYLALNIEYDRETASKKQESPEDYVWAEYDAFYLEGVFRNKKAVCDGIAKAYSLMCNMEGIPCVEVGGNGHAWCKVRLNNRWTAVDPTHGATALVGSDKSVISHEHFCMTDSQKAVLGYSSAEFSFIHADCGFNYFAHKEFTADGITRSFMVSDAEDCKHVINYLLSKSGNSPEGWTIDFLTAKSGAALKKLLKQGIQESDITGQISYSTSLAENYFGGTLVKLMFPVKKAE